MGEFPSRRSHSSKWAGRSTILGQHHTWPLCVFPRSPCVTGAVKVMQTNQSGRNTCKGPCHELRQASVLGRSGKARPALSRPMSAEAPNPTIPKADSVRQLRTLRPRYNPCNHTLQSNRKFPFPCYTPWTICAILYLYSLTICTTRLLLPDYDCLIGLTHYLDT